MPIIMTHQYWEGLQEHERTIFNRAGVIIVDLVQRSDRAELVIKDLTSNWLLLSITDRGLRLGGVIDLPGHTGAPVFLDTTGVAVINTEPPEKPKDLGKHLDKMKGIKL